MLELKKIYKDYIIDKKPFPALKSISLKFRQDGFVCVLGPSGCGKTTLLNIIGGLDQYTKGDLIINGISTKTYRSRDWDNYRNKRIGFVFQTYNLIPHLSILANVELSLVLDGIPRKERRERAAEVLSKVGLADCINKNPNQLSGGQMQRVAIARALINNPEMILADEPTGALDSITSTQVMDLIKELSKDHLVIMVTHNEDIANKYATRVIKMKDGEITSDSNPCDEVLVNSDKKDLKKRKTSMNFFTALNMSLRNLFTKKGRTILTSTAASFGIIGVALVLSLTNGFGNYVGRVESETASQTPINFKAYTSVTKNTQDDLNQKETYLDTTDVFPYVSPSSITTYKYNNFNENYFKFLDYLRDDKKLINEYLINYVDNYSLNLVTDFPASINGKTGGYINNVDYVSGNSVNGFLSSYAGLPTNLFHPLYGEEKYIVDAYDVIAGDYPKANNELVLVIDNTNSINFSILKTLGFYNKDDNSSEVQDLKADLKVKPLTWEDDIKGKKYKVFPNNEYYKELGSKEYQDGEGNSHALKEYATNDVESIYKNESVGKDLNIVGILRPKKTNTIPLMMVGLCYIKDLQTEIVNTNNQSTMASDFENGFVLKDYNGTTQNNFMTLYNEVLKDVAISTITSGTTTTLSTSALSSSLSTTLLRYISFKGITSIDSNYTSLSNYLNDAKRFGCDMIPNELLENGIMNLEYLNSYLSNILELFNEGKLDEAISKLVGIYAYLNSYSVIRNVVVFPKDLASKNALKAALDEYNKITTDASDLYHAHSEFEQMEYTDIASEITGGIGQMITIISVVLIIFASISLAVSCVMTGIITYTSVLERTKEIGILRAVGARKRDVARLFEAESSIVGGISGIIGCAISYLITIPTNLVLNNIYPTYNLGSIADLSVYHVVILIAISVLLTFVSGLIPSSIASKKDPVIALRTE